MSLGAISRARSGYIEISRFLRSLHISHHFAFPNRRIAQVAPAEHTRSFHKAACLFQISKPHFDGSKVIQNFKDILYNSESQSTKENVQDALQKFRASPVERTISLQGYMGVRSDLSKKLSFASLKDVASDTYIQMVSAPSNATDLSHENFKSIRPHEPVIIRGSLRRRPLPKTRSEGDSSAPEDVENIPEILLSDITRLNSLPPDLILKNGAEYGPEQRLHRLRTDALLRNALDTRAEMMSLCLQSLRDSLLVETPVLYKSTSEGANEYLVPTRRKGLAYALPQSPQQFKQILMASGVHKYHQFARCFRDEDLRADRQPEFTQLDIEMSFANGNMIRQIVESKLIRPIWQELLNISLETSFRTMTYQEAMENYGSDKPDLRIPYKLFPAIQPILSTDLVAKMTPLMEPILDALVIPFEAPPDNVRSLVRQFLDSNEALRYHRNPDGAPGIFIYDSSKPLNGLSAFGYEGAEKLENEFTKLDDGHLIVLQARKNAPLSGGSTELGNIRVALHGAAVDAGLLPPLPWKYFEPLWVTDFPLFSPSIEGEPGQGNKTGFKSTHHPFTSPKTARDVDLLLENPTKAVGDHYDLVVNGEEIGGGSMRIHQAAMQEFIFRDVLQMEEEKIAEFSPLLEALNAACPPHAGIALGFDRLVAMVYSHMICKRVSMRDVIAFPKSGSGDDLMMKSPGHITEDQLQRYHLKLRD